MTVKTERRARSRKRPVSLVYVELPPSNGGMMRDLTEQGFGLRAMMPLQLTEKVPFAFVLDNGVRVDGEAIVVRVADRGHVAALEFAGLAAHSRDQIRRWLAKFDEPLARDTASVKPPVAPASTLSELRQEARNVVMSPPAPVVEREIAPLPQIPEPPPQRPASFEQTQPPAPISPPPPAVPVAPQPESLAVEQTHQPAPPAPPPMQHWRMPEPAHAPLPPLAAQEPASHASEQTEQFAPPWLPAMHIHHEPQPVVPSPPPPVAPQAVSPTLEQPQESSPSLPPIQIQHIETPPPAPEPVLQRPPQPQQPMTTLSTAAQFWEPLPPEPPPAPAPKPVFHPHTHPGQRTPPPPLNLVQQTPPPAPPPPSVPVATPEHVSLPIHQPEQPPPLLKLSSVRPSLPPEAPAEPAFLTAPTKPIAAPPVPARVPIEDLLIPPPSLAAVQTASSREGVSPARQIAPALEPLSTLETESDAGSPAWMERFTLGRAIGIMLLLTLLAGSFVYHHEFGHGLIWLGQLIAQDEPSNNLQTAQAPVPSAVAPSPSSSSPADGAKPPDSTPPATAANENKTPEPSATADDNRPSVSPAPAASSIDTGEQEYRQAAQILHAPNRKAELPEAIRLLWVAVNKGNLGAEITLAELYHQGRGVPKSCNQTRILLSVAAQRGSPDAQARLREFQKEGCRD